jgi:hypothetical protein
MTNRHRTPAPALRTTAPDTEDELAAARRLGVSDRGIGVSVHDGPDMYPGFTTLELAAWRKGWADAGR